MKAAQGEGLERNLVFLARTQTSLYGTGNQHFSTDFFTRWCCFSCFCHLFGIQASLTGCVGKRERVGNSFMLQDLWVLEFTFGKTVSLRVLCCPVQL